MKIDSKDFLVRPGEKVKLKDWPTSVKPFCKSKKAYQKLLEEHVDGLSSLQRLHNASNRYALLLIFQGMDAAGKDGAIRHVMSGVNPQGCQVSSFNQPSADELEHDFLWRTTRQLPERGHIGTYGRFKYGAPPSSSADWGWVQHMAASLKPSGRMAVVLDTGAVSRGSRNQGSFIEAKCTATGPPP